MITLKVSGKTKNVDVDPGTPLLWVRAFGRTVARCDFSRW